MSTTTREERSTSTPDHGGFSVEERAAMKDRAREARAAAKRISAAEKADIAKREVVAKIEEMEGRDREVAETVHAVVTATEPRLEPRLWDGMPAYAIEGTIVCHFQPAAKFKNRYATLGFSDEARLDDGAIWPVSFALSEVSDAVEQQIAALVRRAVP